MSPTVLTPGSTAKRALLAATAAVAALTLAACSSGSAEEEPASSDSAAPDTSAEAAAASYGDIAVQLSWIKNEEFSGEFFADSKGYYTDAGFETVSLTPGPSTGVAELVSGQADVALSDAVSIGSGIGNEGAPLKIIGATYQKNPFTVLSLADGGNIMTPEDMVGKKIGVQDSNTALFLALLAANGLTEDDVEIVPVQYDPAPLVSGEVDGFIAYLTNESLILQAEGHEVTNLPFADNGLPFVAETFSVTDDAIANDREKLKAFLVAEIKGWTDAVNDPAEGSRLAVEEYGADLGLDPEVSAQGATVQAEELVVSDETAENGLFTISDELQTETVASLAGAGIEITEDQLFDMSLLDEVYAENPDLVAYAG
ncbi:ABC transporter substrate-binding protein [Demequina sp. NBRC 110057]|uniref:ABC transporter substrate-binding protein n=1 Tax=Demequina sp. NBRC 110057 TaxID=1570346 RepID=UPI000A078636|nr:ABC transporter substrate-binding protein [Demequina sp. NBRC 110057]